MNCFSPIRSEIKCIIDAFGSHLNIDLQQRSVEFSQLFKAHEGLRPALLEKMPPMQVQRVNQNSEYAEDNDGNELIENGIDADANTINTTAGDSVSNPSVYITFCGCNRKLRPFYSFFVGRMHYWTCWAAPISR